MSSIPTLSRTTTGSGGSTGAPATRQGGLVGAVVAFADASRRARAAVATGVGWLAQTVTPAGWVVGGFATVGIATGWMLGWIEWIVAGSASLVLLALSAPFLFGARGYDVTMHVDHERVVAGDSVEGEIGIRNRGTRTALPGRIDLPVGSGLVELAVPFLRPGHRIAQPVTIAAPRRGVIVVGPATAVRTDPIGLLRREHRWDDVRELYVHPRTVVIPATSAGLVRDLEGNPSRRLVDADMSFHAIRPYAPGDSRRQIHWRSTAKSGQLMVRQFEESLRSRLAVVVDLAPDDYAAGEDADEFELAISAAASLAVQAVRDGRDVNVIAGAELDRRRRGPSITTLQARTPRTLLDGFARVNASPRTLPLEAVCRRAVEQADALSLAVVVCGSAVTPTRLRQAALAFAADTAVIAVVCDESGHPRVQPLGGLTVLTIEVLDDLAALLLRGVQT